MIFQASMIMFHVNLQGCNKTLFSMHWEEKPTFFLTCQEEDGSGPSFAGKPTPVLDVSAKESLCWNKKCQHSGVWKRMFCIMGIRMDKDECKVSTKVQQKINCGILEFSLTESVFFLKWIPRFCFFGIQATGDKGGSVHESLHDVDAVIPSIQKASAWCYMASRYL